MITEHRIGAAITAVTVYPRRARVSASGEVALEAGRHRVLIEGLPLSLLPESVRVGGRGSMPTRLGGVDVSKQFHEQTPTEAVRALEEEILGAKDLLSALADNAAVLEGQRQYLQGLREATTQYAKGLAKGSMSVEEQRQLVDFVADMDRQTREQLRGHETERRELDRRLKKLEAELAELRSMQVRQQYAVIVDVEADEAGKFYPEVNYDVSQVSWTPLYDMRLLQDDGHWRLEITAFAEIRQRSGQDWKGVALHVSTARPRSSQTLPELSPWYVMDAAELRPRAARTQPPGEALLQAAPAPASRAPSVEAQPEGAVLGVTAEATTAEVGRQDMSIVFHVPGGTDIPSDNAPHKALLTTVQARPRFTYLTTPKAMDGVVRKAEWRNESQSPMLAASANLFVGQDFLGTARVDYVPTEGEFELPFGFEDRIEVERKMIRRDVDKVRLRDRRQLSYGYEIVLTNRLEVEAEVEVVDQIPTAQHEEIKVSLTDAKPAPVEQDQLGELTWRVALAPGEERTISFEFQVEHPRQMRILGL